MGTETRVMSFDFKDFAGRKVLVAMSGGVDSALAAALLKRAGADVIGVHMRVWRHGGAEGAEGRVGGCCSPADAADARRVAQELDFPFYCLDFEAEFRRAVIDPFIRDYMGGRTPNPCVACNSKLKLGTLLARARAWGADAVATGHYARLRPGRAGRVELLRATDASKDQSYYLFDLSQAQLRQFLMPVGEMRKAEVRALARELGLHLAAKPDSQDICFVADGDYRRFLREEGGAPEDDLGGPIVDARGTVLGVHRGIHRFTIGQRRGLGVASSRPLYVVDLAPETRTVVVGFEEEARSEGLVARGFNWVSREPAPGPLRVRARIRYHHEPAPATLRWEAATGQARVDFEEPQRAVAPGQAVVCYDNDDHDIVLGGGWIERRLPTSKIDTVPRPPAQ